MLEVFISDVHLPFEDRASWQLTLNVIKDIKPNMVFLGGDILDCVTPDTKILTSTGNWIPAGELKEGQNLIGFDEYGVGTTPLGHNQPRKLRRSLVTKLGRAMQPVYKLYMSDGTELKSSVGHRWLGWGVNKKRGVLKWMTTQEIVDRIESNKHQPVLLCKPCNVWERQYDYESGYIAAALDGEGHLTFNGKQNNFGHIAFSQKPNIFMNNVNTYLINKGFSTYISQTPTRQVQQLNIKGGLWEHLKFIGMFDVPRFTEKWIQNAPIDGYKGLDKQRSSVVKVEYLGVQEIVMIETSSKTYIAEGFASHNCYAVSQYDREPNRKLTLQQDLDYAFEELSRLRKACPKGTQILYLEGNHECFDDETECLTQDGWKHYSDLTELDKVASYNKDTGQIDFDYPLSIYKNRYVGKMVSIVTRNTDLFITPNHRMVFTSDSRGGKRSILPFEDIPLVSFDIPTSGGQNKSEYNITDDEIRLASWILTDGSVCNTPTIYQRKSKSYMIQELLDRAGWSYTLKERQRYITEICGTTLLKTPEPECKFVLTKESAKYSKELVNNSKKNLPDWVFELSERQFDIFLESFIDGDGTRSGRTTEKSGTLFGIESLLSDLQRACILNNYRAYLTKNVKGDNLLYVTKRNKSRIRKANTQYENYDGMIWCVTTKNDTVIVRRNGKVSITGNTRLSRYLNSKAEELSVLDAIKLPQLLKLDKLKIKWIPNGSRTKIGKLWHLHGNEIAGGGANIAKSKFDRLGTNIIFGHHHKMQSFIKRNYEGEVCGAWANPCLSDLQPDYAHFTDWVLGFSVIEYSDYTGNFNVDQVAIDKPHVNSRKASCFIRGKEYDVEVGKDNANTAAPYANKKPVIYEGVFAKPDTDEIDEEAFIQEMV